MRSIRLNAPNKSHDKYSDSFITEAHDADLHASNLTDWQQQYDQISCGSFYGRIIELPFTGGLQVFHEYTNQKLQQRCQVWPDAIWLGIPLAEQALCRIDGLSIQPDNIMCRPSACNFNLSTPTNYQLYGIVVEQTKLLHMAQIHGVELNWRELNEYGRLRMPEATLAKVRFLLARLLSGYSALDKKRAPIKLQQDLVMMLLLEVLQRESPQPANRQGYYHRKKVVDDACCYVKSRAFEPVTISQLCAITNVSHRTLQYSFTSILGISPIQYLRLSRLNGARRTLLQTQKNVNQTVESVSKVATEWGFWHLSQFAKDYKQLFNELPSQTLSKRI
ncbi:helix-turn-helix domain-containing protein [Marinomonas agarivorans]|nr:helix-turn-helix domain-containing protein [Marinomonas agarivorans]